MAEISIGDVVTRLWPGQPASIEPLSGGITNSNYRVDVGDGAYAVRLAGQRTELLGIDRSSEVDARRIAASLGIGPELVHVDLDLGVIVTRFLHGRPIGQEEVGAEPVLADVARALKNVHKAGRIDATFDTFRLVPSYRRTAASSGVSPPFDYPGMLSALDRIAGVRPWRPAALCHNDLLNSNLLYDGSVRIVDWEYAGMGDGFFDLGNIAVNHGFTPSQEEALLRHYFGHADETHMAALQLFKLASEAREAMWGVVQRAISSLEIDFDDYARTHAAGFFAVLDTIDFDEALRLTALVD